MRRRTLVREVPALIVALGACLAIGCTSLPKRAKGPGHAVALYFQDRVEDAFETFDVGLTWSTKPGFAVYGNGVSVSPGGIAYVDGYFLGLGGGQLGVTSFYQASLGLVAWGYEEVGWGDFDRAIPGTLDRQGVGVLGLLLPPYGRPSYTPS